LGRGKSRIVITLGGPNSETHAAFICLPFDAYWAGFSWNNRATDSLAVCDDQMLRTELRIVWQNLSQLSEGTSDEGLLAQVLAGQWMGAHHSPVDVLLRHMIKKGI
jgi:hypothetical protein